MKNRLRKLLAGALAVTMLASTLPAAFAAEEGEKHLTILGTSDMHGNIWGYSYEDDKDPGNNGMARLYTYIQQVREENPNTILIDAGDDIQGTIMTDDIYNKTPDEAHPVIDRVGLQGDAMTVVVCTENDHISEDVRLFREALSRDGELLGERMRLLASLLKEMGY